MEKIKITVASGAKGCGFDSRRAYKLKNIKKQYIKPDNIRAFFIGNRDKCGQIGTIITPVFAHCFLIDRKWLDSFSFS